jgi:3-oxoacyl-[acyl-carrier protein] reductase
VTALAHLTRTLDLEVRPYGIRVNVVAPQLIDTASNRAGAGRIRITMIRR